MQKRTVIGVRSHRFGEAEQLLIDALSAVFGKDGVFIVLDETSGCVEVPMHQNAIRFNNGDMDRLNLYRESLRTGWLCGDYFYYFLREKINADYYWLIEPDVKFTFANLQDFFHIYEPCSDDLIAPSMGPRGAGWFWYNHISRFTENVYGCAFPLTRLSGVAIDILLQRRSQDALLFKGTNESPDRWPNDESFVASVSHEMNLSCRRMESLLPQAFTHFSVNLPFCWQSAGSHIPAGKVVHPALDGKYFQSALERKIVASLNRSGLSEIFKTALLGADQQQQALVGKAFENAVNHFKSRFID